MPWATPVRIARSLVARARIKSPPALPPGRTPKISASNSSTRWPSKTVRTVAFWPGLTWSGVRVGTAALAGRTTASGAATATRATHSTCFIGPRL